MMKMTLQIVLSCFLLCSCKETTKDLSQESDKSEAINELKEILNELTNDKAVDEEEMTNGSAHDIKIQFSDLTISIKDIDVSWWGNGRTSVDNIYETKNNTYKTETDTAFFNLNPGDWMFDKSFKIEQPSFDIVALYGQLEVKVALKTKREMDVPVCILEDWKGYTSKWRELKIDQKDLKFSDFEEQTDRPISFLLDEFKLAAEEHCGPEWSDEIKDIDTLDKLPIYFFTTSYTYKIRARNRKTNQVIEKYVVFYTPTSC